jgi:isochorismate synthase
LREPDNHVGHRQALADRMEKVNVTNLQASESLYRVLSGYHHKGYSFALWKLPESPSFYLAASEQVQQLAEVSLEESLPGFLFSPFNPSDAKIFLPADEFLIIDAGRITQSHGTTLDELLRQNETPAARRKVNHYSNPHVGVATYAFDYKQLVSKCREEIRGGNFEKIVPSRAKTVALPDSFDLLEAFNRLCQLYPLAMVSAFSSPLTGTWIGATPEMLVSATKDQHFHTVALAGTQPYEPGIDVRSVTWTQKDIEEQALVERYIISCFKKIRLREYEEHGPKTVIAGNVLHLKTDFEVDMTSTNFPQLGSVMLKLLHPTSAVCGMPLDASLAFLKLNEGYNRQYYSGYLGPVNVGQESHLYVNLRCMQLFANEATLYAGAGVLADSDPDKEWNETEMKMKTLEAIIRK